MRLVLSVKFAIGMVVAGSAVVTFAGSALAADSPVAPEVKPSAQDQPAAAASAAKSETTALKVVQDGTATFSSDSTTTINNVKEASSSSQAGASGQEGPAAVSVIPTPTSANKQAEETRSVAKEAVTKDISGPVVAAGQPMVTQSVDGASSLAAAASTALTEAANASKREAANIAGWGVETVLFHQQTLPVQPVIISHPVLSNDLAAAIPSAPSTTKAPAAPAKSNGLLAALTTGTASTVAFRVNLPDMFQAFLLVRSGMDVGTVSVTLMLLMMMGFVALARKSGYVHSPRSDADSVQTGFVASLSMGYASVIPNQHSPFFVASEGRS